VYHAQRSCCTAPYAGLVVSNYLIFLSTGYDYAEAVTDALNEVLSLSWRTTATKICVFVSDTPPHELGMGGDGFPQGNI
jgi:hypothetical protein